MNVLEKLLKIHWGEKSLVALYVSVLSGIILALQYDASDPYYSVNFLDLLVPFGAFWRALHFYASQFFFLFSLAHLLVIMKNCGLLLRPQSLDSNRPTGNGPDGCATKLDMSRWIRLILSIPVILLLLFTGYILRGDATGEAAGVIAENITLSIPVVGAMFDRLLFSVSTKGMLVVYANHLIGLGIVWGYLSWEHLRRFKVSWKRHGEVVALLVLISVFISAPLETEKIGVFHRPGPWFFLGLQELLRYIQPFWAGVVFPMSGVIALCLLLKNEFYRKKGLFFLCLWSVAYAALTGISLVRLYG